MRRRQPPVCKRHGCSAGRKAWQLVCDACWFEAPRDLRDRYSRAHRAKLTRIAGEIGREMLRKLGRKSVNASATTPTDTYARNCALLGEHDELLAAE